MTPYRIPIPQEAPPAQPRHSLRAWLKFQFMPIWCKCPYCNSRQCPHTNLVSIWATSCMIIAFGYVLYALIHKAL